eukprot:RCo012570
MSNFGPEITGSGFGLQTLQRRRPLRTEVRSTWACFVVFSFGPEARMFLSPFCTKSVVLSSSFLLFLSRGPFYPYRGHCSFFPSPLLLFSFPFFRPYFFFPWRFFVQRVCRFHPMKVSCAELDCASRFQALL